MSVPFRLVLGLEKHLPAARVGLDTSSGPPHPVLLPASSSTLPWHRPSIAGVRHRSKAVTDGQDLGGLPAPPRIVLPSRSAMARSRSLVMCWEISAVRELLCPILVISSRVPAPAGTASVLPVWRRSWKCGSAVTPAAFRGLTQSSRKLLRRNWPPCGPTNTCPSRHPPPCATDRCPPRVPRTRRHVGNGTWGLVPARTPIREAPPAAWAAGTVVLADGRLAGDQIPLAGTFRTDGFGDPVSGGRVACGFGSELAFNSSTRTAVRLRSRAAALCCVQGTARRPVLVQSRRASCGTCRDRAGAGWRPCPHPGGPRL